MKPAGDVKNTNGEDGSEINTNNDDDNKEGSPRQTDSDGNFDPDVELPTDPDDNLDPDGNFRSSAAVAKMKMKRKHRKSLTSPQRKKRDVSNKKQKEHDYYLLICRHPCSPRIYFG